MQFRDFIKTQLLFMFLIICVLSCERQAKLTAHLKPIKTIERNISTEALVSNVSFLFIVDTSGSMSLHKKKLAQNVNLFLSPLFSNYPQYNYNFAITTLNPSSEITQYQKPFFLKNNEAFKICDIQHSSFKQSPIYTTAALGSYIHYSSLDLRTLPYKKLVCLISYNIGETTGYADAGTEFYFDSLNHILSVAGDNFKQQFLGDKNLLVLFFISDAIGDGYIARNANARPEPILKKIKEMNPHYIYSYAIVPDKTKGDDCGENGPRKVNTSVIESYPEHVYKFINETEGKVFSICEDLWGQNLVEVFSYLQNSLSSVSFFLDDVPQLDTLEVFLNNKKIDKNINTGWFFNPENLSVNLGKSFIFSFYIDDDDENHIITIKYNPVNIDILKQDQD